MDAMEAEGEAQQRSNEDGNADIAIDSAAVDVLSHQGELPLPTDLLGTAPEDGPSAAGDNGEDLLDFLSDPSPQIGNSSSALPTADPFLSLISEYVNGSLEPSSSDRILNGGHDTVSSQSANEELPGSAVDVRISSQGETETDDLLSLATTQQIDINGDSPAASTTDAQTTLDGPSLDATEVSPLPESPSHEGSPGAVERIASNPAEKASHSNGQAPADIAPATSSSADSPPLPAMSSENDADQSVASRRQSLEDRVHELESQLSDRESTAKRREEETTALLMELQESLQQQMSAKAEAENKSRLLEAKMKHLEEVNEKQSKELAEMADLQSMLQEHLEAKAEAEQKSRASLDRIAQLEADALPQTDRITALESELSQLQQLHTTQSDELAKIRAERDDQHRKEQSLVSRLNAAKKEQAEHANLAERLEDEIRALEQDLESTKKELSEVSHAKVLVENELEVVKKTSENRIRSTESALLDERNLNEERKRKMKLFVESKSEELRQAKADNDSLQAELAQTNKSLVDLNGRWKQLHAQWVQSQTRNRELQRDLNRIKKDSENLHKVGDTLEMKLSRSATETEEHKTKRLAAKHELMTVLRALEVERELTTKLRDCLKFTFTPKALSQQQLLREGLEDFEAQLQKLALRLGRTLPGSGDADASMNSDAADHSDPGLMPDAADRGIGDESNPQHSRTDAEVQRLISKLEHETQRVSQGIMALSGNIERMHLMLDASGDRTCYTVLSELLTSGGLRATSTSSSSGAATPEETRRLGSVRSSHQYGQVPSSLRD